uniref:Uncharacterized protein n=1 Tax=Populus trichocarpa TaxID=3694 RepID=A0A3N7EBP1_POPTR
MLLLFASIHNKLFTFVRRLFTYVYSVNCYDWERERAGDEANEYGVLWTMPLVLPLVFFFSDSFYSIAFFFCSSLSFLSLFLSLLVSVLFFSDLLFKGGEPGGAGILGGKAGALALAGQCFPLSVYVFPSLTLRSSFPGSFFSVLLFSCVCSSSLSPSVCIIHFLCSVCPLCVCPLFLFLFVLYLSPGSFLFSFPLFSFFVRASVMACIVGARRMLP